MHKNLCLQTITVVLLFVVLAFPVSSWGESGNGGITGIVFDAEANTPLPGATIVVRNSFSSSAANREGSFLLGNLTPGTYFLQVSHVGYATQIVDSIVVKTSELTRLDIHLIPQPVSLKEITVTPGRFNIMGEAPAAKQSLTQREMQTMPQLADDFFRAVNRLPGVSSNDFSTRFTIRGGEYEEVLVMVDGLQIYEPFHLKDIDGGAMSIIDIAAMRSIELMTGGFSAEYGDKNSGVLNILSRSVPPDERRVSAGISLINARALAEGTFAENRGSWLLAARRGYIDYVLNLTDPDNKIDPRYYDVFGKVQYRLGDHYLLAVDVLHAGDNLSYIGEDGDEGDSLYTTFDNSYLWFNLWSKVYPKLSAQTIAAVGKVDHHRYGQNFLPWAEGPGHIVQDNEDFGFVQFTSDWEYDAAEQLVVKFGADARQVHANYDYLSREFFYYYYGNLEEPYAELARIDTLGNRLDKSGTKFAAYVTNRIRLAQPLVTEVGLRYDNASYSHDDLISPRVNVVYDLNEKTTVRAGWGYYYQTEGIYEISVGDGETEFYPAQKAEHRVIGFEHEHAGGVHFRLELYDKVYSDLMPAYRNSFDDIEAFPEREDDRAIVHRASTSSRGFEMYLKKDNGRTFSWWFSYAYAKVEDSVRYIYFPPEDATAYENIAIPSPNDQRHTFYADIQYRPTPRWQCTMAFQYHTGWPYTDVYLASQNTAEGTVYWAQAGQPWGTRHEAFHRLDVRVNRHFPLARGRITAFVEMLNLLDHENVRMYDYSFYWTQGRPVLEKEPEYWFGRIPSFGVSYELSF